MIEDYSLLMQVEDFLIMFSVKDDEELFRIKKASLFTADVMQNVMIL